jgi:hypothetical protein
MEHKHQKYAIWDEYKKINDSTSGGYCQCPSGKVYVVGTHDTGCPHLACSGGTKSICFSQPGHWSGYGVTCSKINSEEGKKPHTDG